MKSIQLPVYERSIKYGYLFWKKEHDQLLKELLNGLEYVHVYLQNSYLGLKRIDWKYRRISLGYKWTRFFLQKCRNISINKINKDTIHITCLEENKRKLLIESESFKEHLSHIGQQERYNRAKTIHTIHVWWARRPTSAMRFLIFSSLVYDNDRSREVLKKLASLIHIDDKTLHQVIQLMKQSTTSDIKVLDPFSGGGTIPFEACRLGLNTYSIEINPLAVFIQKSILEYTKSALNDISEEELIDIIKNSGEKILRKLEYLTNDLFPLRKEGVITYLWTYKYKCPHCGYTFYLSKRLKLSKKQNLYLDIQDKKTEQDMYICDKEGQTNWTNGGVRCPKCKTKIKHPSIQHSDEQPVVIVKRNESGKRFELAPPEAVPTDIIRNRIQKLLRKLKMKPFNTKLPKWSGIVNASLYGIETYWDLHNDRQKAVLLTLIYVLKNEYTNLVERYNKNIAKFVIGILSCLIDQLVDWNSRLSMWISENEQVGRAFCGPGVPMLFDYAEIDPVASSPANLHKKLERVLKVIPDIITAVKRCYHIDIQKGYAQKLNYPDNFFDLVITDPPYYDNIFYSVLADAFYLWKKPVFRHIEPELFRKHTTANRLEIVSSSKQDPELYHIKYVSKLSKSFKEISRVLKNEGLFVLLYSHLSIKGWEALIKSFRKSKFFIVNTQPMIMERKHRPRAMRSNSSNISIIFIARKFNKKRRKVFLTDLEKNFENVLKSCDFEFYKKLKMSNQDIGLFILSKIVMFLANTAGISDNNTKQIIPDEDMLKIFGGKIKEILPGFHISDRNSL